MSKKEKGKNKEMKDKEQDLNAQAEKNASAENEESKNTEKEQEEVEQPTVKDEQAGDDEVKTEEAELEKADSDFEQKFYDMQDKYLRLTAEFDNYRKRTLKEKSELMKSANADILLGLLPVVDDFDRGVQNLDEARDMEAIKKGIELIYNKFKEFIKQNGVEEIDALKQEFNTDEHEALTKIPAPEEELKGKVVDVIQKGYKLNDKVIRFAKVVVGE
jgi:molecular chaperone GrpE